MTRASRPVALDSDLMLALLIGPVERFGLTEEDLELGWHHHGGRLMEDHPAPTGKRAWGWWRFVAGEKRPAGDLETVRLAELGELKADELAALRERANEARLRVGTPAERVSGGGLSTPGAVSMDRRAVELFEAVRAA